MKITKYALMLVFVSIVLSVPVFLAKTWLNIRPVAEISTRPQPKTEPKPPKEYKVIAIGDIACAPTEKPTDKTCQAEAVANALANSKPDAVLLPGDIQYDKGELENFKTAFDKYYGALTPIIYPAPGNHEYGTPNASGYFAYWQEKQKMVGISGEGFYDFTLGGWKIYALNSNCEMIGGCGADSPQGKWLKNKLLTKESDCSVAFWHHPVFSSGRYKGDAKTITRGSYFWQELYEHKSEIVLNGHDHNYERFAKQGPDGTASANGIRQFTVGTGGKSLYALNQLKTPNHEFGNDAEFGYLELTLKPNSYGWSYKNINGQELDSGSDRCK